MHCAHTARKASATTDEEDRLPDKRRIPTYVWTLLALVTGLAAGGLFPAPLEPVADATSTLISWVVVVVPLLILAALSPAIATLVRRGLAGRFAGAVVLWYVFTSTVAGLIAVVTSAVIFRIPLTTARPGHLGRGRGNAAEPGGGRGVVAAAGDPRGRARRGLRSAP